MDQQNRKNRRITQDDYFKLRCFLLERKEPCRTMDRSQIARAANSHFSTDIYAGCHVVRCAKDAGVEIVNRTPGNPQGKTAPAVIVKRVEQLETMVAVLEKEVAELKA